MLAAAEARAPAIDKLWPDPRDPAELQAEITAACDGFAGKLCIQPDQLEAVALAFTPSPERVQWVTAVVELFAANPNAGVLTPDDKMLDHPHLTLA